VVFVAWAYIVKRKGVRVLSQKNRQIVEEKQKSEKLLLNILPETIAHELKEHGKTRPQRHENATVMFTDFEGFTKFSEKHSPEDLVHLLDHYFQAFDQVMHKYHIEKIKTIGDAYMVVGGIPLARPDHAEAVAELALEIHQVMEKLSAQTGKTLRVRIGMNSGPVTAGVIGKNKFLYDLWGDVVNTASRMESHGTDGGIQVTEVTYERLKSKYVFQERGTIFVKGKGEMITYLLMDRR